MSSIENVIGGGGGDTLSGDNNANQLQGGAGNEAILYNTAGAADEVFTTMRFGA